MAQSLPQDLPKDKFLMIAINLLHRQLVVAPRTQAKRLARELLEGRIAELTSVKMEDDSMLYCRLELDQSEFRGKLNFGALRDSLGVLTQNIAQALREKRDVTVFNMQKRESSVLFGVTGVTVAEGQSNVLVLGADTSGGPGKPLLRLMYLDPQQFAGQDSAATGQAEA